MPTSRKQRTGVIELTNNKTEVDGRSCHAYRECSIASKTVHCRSSISRSSSFALISILSIAWPSASWSSRFMRLTSLDNWSTCNVYVVTFHYYESSEWRTSA